MNKNYETYYVDELADVFEGGGAGIYVNRNKKAYGIGFEIGDKIVILKELPLTTPESVLFQQMFSQLERLFKLVLLMEIYMQGKYGPPQQEV